MSELGDIFTYAMPGTVFVFVSVVLLLLCAAVAMWPRNRSGSPSRRDGRSAGRDYAPDASSIRS
jgi:hypothetical protein